MILEIGERTGASIRRICRVLEVPRSGFYHATEPTAIQRLDDEIAERIEIIFKQHRQRYGYRRIWRQLADEGWICSPRRVRRLMKKRGVRAVSPKRFVPKTSDGKALEPAPNLLKHQTLPQLPNEVWTADITYIPSRTGWLYLAVVLDLYSRKIIGWKLANHMRSELVLQALEEALQSTGSIPKSAIFHSDRGSQYGSWAFRNALKKAGFSQSMSACSNPYDNAWTESFFGSFKPEMLQKGSFDNFQDAQTEIFEYINGYYNTHRKHSALGYMTPSAFQRKSLVENQTLKLSA
jgi:putative transposase